MQKKKKRKPLANIILYLPSCTLILETKKLKVGKLKNLRGLHLTHRINTNRIYEPIAELKSEVCRVTSHFVGGIQHGPMEFDLF